jgi:hypothetical protein
MTKFKSHVYRTKNNYPNVRFRCETVDLSQLKSVTLNLCFWLNSTHDFKSEVRLLFQGCKRVLSKYADGVIFSEHVICINMAPDTVTSDSFYVCFEFTLFPIRNFENKQLSMTILFDSICHSIYHQVFEGMTNIYKKKPKILNDQD